MKKKDNKMKNIRYGVLVTLLIFSISITGVANANTESFVINFETVKHINVISPNGGENWIKGTTNTIKWSSYGNPGPYVRIELLKNGIKYNTISYTSPNVSLDWKSRIGVGDNYKVRITSISNSKYNDTSDK